jgi:invasion protein IalB
MTIKPGLPARRRAAINGDCPISTYSAKSDRQVELRRFAGGSTKEGRHLMIHGNALAPARPAGRRLGAFAKTAALTVVLAAAASVAVAQQPKKPAAKKPAPAPAQQQQQPAPQPGQQEPVQLIYSPWTKFCLKSKDTPPKQVCFTGKDARIESGMPVVAAVLIEPEGDPKKILRVTLPLGMQLIHGTRVIVDQNQPMTAPYVICFTNGCMADYEADAAMIDKMKKGKGLVVQAINASGQPISVVLPLTDFAKAYEGPPTDPKVFEEQQQKLQEELQKRAEAARKKLEQSQPGASAAPPTQGKTQ